MYEVKYQLILFHYIYNHSVTMIAMFVTGQKYYEFYIDTYLQFEMDYIIPFLNMRIYANGMNEGTRDSY